MTCMLRKARSPSAGASASIHRIQCTRLSRFITIMRARTHDMTPHRMHILALLSPPPESKRRCTYLAHALHAYRPTGRGRSGTAPPLLPLSQLADRMRARGSVHYPGVQKSKVLHADGFAVQLAFRIVWWHNTQKNNVNRIANDRCWRSLSVWISI